MVDRPLHQVGNARLWVLRDRLDRSCGKPSLGEQIARAIERSLPGGDNDDEPVGCEPFRRVPNRAVGVSDEGGNRVRRDALFEARVQRRHREVFASSHVGPELVELDEIGVVEVDGNLATITDLVPRRCKELTVRQTKTLGSSADSVGGNNNDGRVVWEERNERHNAVDECRQKRFHSRHSDSLRDWLSECPQRRRPLGLQCCPLSDGCRERNFPHRRQFDGCDFAERSLVGNRKLAEVVDVVTKEVAPHGVPSERWENVEDSTPNCHFTAARNHVDALIPEFNERAADIERVTPIALSEDERLGTREVG